MAVGKLKWFDCLRKQATIYSETIQQQQPWGYRPLVFTSYFNCIVVNVSKVRNSSGRPSLQRQRPWTSRESNPALSDCKSDILPTTPPVESVSGMNPRRSNSASCDEQLGVSVRHRIVVDSDCNPTTVRCLR